MVVESSGIDLDSSILGYLAFFLGQRVNELVVGRLMRAGFKQSRESHGYVVQHLIERDRSISELARRMGVTQQAASKITAAEMIRLGILEAKTALRPASEGDPDIESRVGVHPIRPEGTGPY